MLGTVGLKSWGLPQPLSDMTSQWDVTMSDDEAVPPRRPSLGNVGGSGPQPLCALSDDEGSLVAVPRGAHYKRKGPLVAVPRGVLLAPLGILSDARELSVDGSCAPGCCAAVIRCCDRRRWLLYTRLPRCCGPVLR